MKASKRVLVIEDVDEVAALIREVLSPLAEVQLASSLADARAMLQRERFGCIVSDWRLRGKDALELLSELRDRNDPLAQRFILITGEEPSFDPGCPVLIKPFSFPELIALVEQMLASSEEE